MAAENAIKWPSLMDIEMRIVDEAETLDLLNARLDQFLCQDDSQDCHLPLMSLSHVRSLIDADNNDCGFNDIPGLPVQKYNDCELELWAALISEYRAVATKVPKYTKVLIWSGIPPALRGMAWMSMSEAHSQTLRSLYDSLAAEWTPFVKIIGRDLNRTFPEIRMFQEREGKGQMKLGKVLRAYSAYDMQVGYCQGLTFLTGPLLLHMDDCDAFCVLVKLMEDYELRSMFTADMAGLKLRVYQFEQLLLSYLPELEKHLKDHGVPSIYATQWFLSFFAVTCPLAMLVRIYDLMFAEGAVPTMMRVALAVLKRNQQVLLSYNDDERILERLLGRSLWDVYNMDADLLLTDITSISDGLLGKITALEVAYHTDGKLNTKKLRSQPSKAAGLTNRFPSIWISTGDETPPDRPKMDRMKSKVSIRSISSETTLARHESRSSASSVNSLSDNEDASRSELKEKIEELKAELARTKLALDIERREREVDKDLVDSVISRVNVDDLTDGHFRSALCTLKDRMGIKGREIATDGNDNCKSCERLLMDLATARANEAMARQELDELGDRLLQLSTEKELKKSPSKWGIWA